VRPPDGPPLDTEAHRRFVALRRRQVAPTLRAVCERHLTESRARPSNAAVRETCAVANRQRVPTPTNCMGAAEIDSCITAGRERG
jgi:hypothetical protein